MSIKCAHGQLGQRKDWAKTQVPQGTVKAETGGMLTVYLNRSGQGYRQRPVEGLLSRGSEAVPRDNGLPLKTIPPAAGMRAGGDEIGLHVLATSEPPALPK